MWMWICVSFFVYLINIIVIKKGFLINLDGLDGLIFLIFYMLLGNNVVLLSRDKFWMNIKWENFMKMCFKLFVFN